MSSATQGYVQGSYTRKAGRIEQGEARLAAQQIELEQTAREADRKERLARSMATTIASAGASGVSALEGSPLTILKESIRREEVATQRDKYMSQLEAMTARYRGKMAKMGSQAAAHQQQKQGRSQSFWQAWSMGMSMGANTGDTSGSTTGGGQTSASSGSRDMSGSRV